MKKIANTYKGKHVLSMEKYSFSRSDVVPYFIICSLGNHRFFLGPLSLQGAVVF
jgi:hypothetical protein